MIYAYLRVSTDKQDEANQKDGVDRYADYARIVIDEYCIEHGISGAKDYRQRKLGKLMEKLVSGDRLIVSEFTRLSRDTLQMYEICKTLVDKGVAVYSVKDNQTLDFTADGKFRLAMYCYFAEKERERCKERTKEALARAKKNGVKLGRPKGTRYFKLSTCRDYIAELLKAGYSVREIANRTGVCWSTAYRFIMGGGICALERFTSVQRLFNRKEMI